MPDQQNRDQNVLIFMMQLVQQKYGDDVDSNFLVNESNKLYDEFGEALVDYFSGLMSEEQEKEFGRLSDSGAPNNMVLEFLMREIPELDDKIKKVLSLFKDRYINS